MKSSYFLGEELDWTAPAIPVKLIVELPFWIMVPNCVQKVEVNGHVFEVVLADYFVEQYAGSVTNSRSTCVYVGPEVGQKNDPKLMTRKCKTVLLISSECNKDVLAANRGQNAKLRLATLFLKDFCMAHLPVANKLIQQYRLATYDYFPFEISPWDVPIWYVASDIACETVVLLNYAEWDRKPGIVSRGSTERYELIDEAQLKVDLDSKASAGEFELLDALNLMETGDYSSAVRRITTAIEAQTESVFRQELLKHYSPAQAEKKLRASMYNFPRRLREYEELSKREMPAELHTELKATRDMRQKIVHEGFRIAFQDRGQAQESVDTGRWIFNWLENQPDRSGIREKLIAKRSIGRTISIFETEITPAGVIVHPL